MEFVTRTKNGMRYTVLVIKNKYSMHEINIMHESDDELCIYIDHFQAMCNIADNKLVFDNTEDLSISKITIFVTEDQKHEIEKKAESIKSYIKNKDVLNITLTHDEYRV